MIIVDVKQGTPEWHSFRKDGIGGSDAPVIEGSSPYHTPRTLYFTKRGELVEDISENEYIFAKGHKTEGLVRKNFAELTGAEMLPLCLIHDKHSHIRASLDGFDQKKYGILEAKLVGKAVLEDARDEGIIPRHHWVQIQHNMEVAGVDLGQWYGHNGNDNGVLIEVKRDNTFITAQLQREHEFWEMIKAGKVPALTENDELVPDDLSILNALYEAKVLMDNAEANFDAIKAKLDSYGHPRVRGAGIVAYKSSRQGNLDIKSIPGVKTLLESYTEKYIEKHRKPPSKPSWTVKVGK